MKLTAKPVVLLISLFFPPEVGGGATGAWNRASIFLKMGYSVFVLTAFPGYPSGKVSDERYKGRIFCVEHLECFTILRIRVLPIKYIGFTNNLLIFLNFVLFAIIFFPKIIRITGPIEIIYARSPVIFSSIVGYVYSRTTRSFFIYEAADLWPEELVAFGTHLSFVLQLFGRSAAQFSYHLPDIIVTVSKRSGDHISREYKPRRPVYGIPVGVDPTRFPKISKIAARLHLVNEEILSRNLVDKFIVLYSGIISNAQQIDSLAYAASKLKDEKEIAILIIGEGPSKKNLQQLMVDLELENFHVLSSQPRILMPTIISAADICAVLLSSEAIFDIALPTKFYEYIACAKPVLGVCRGELAEVIETNEIGKVVTSANAEEIASTIKILKNSCSSLSTMVNNCESTLQSYSLDRIASDFFEILKNEMKIAHYSHKLRLKKP
jgi:colanic acid biosynthesis glycosyl transferase WcaI